MEDVLTRARKPRPPRDRLRPSAIESSDGDIRLEIIHHISIMGAISSKQDIATPFVDLTSLEDGIVEDDTVYDTQSTLASILKETQPKPASPPPPSPPDFIKYGRDITLDHLEPVRMLGEGCFGKVELMKHRQTGELLAVKTAKPLTLKMLLMDRNILSALSLDEEGTIMSTLSHPNVVKLEAFQGTGAPTPFIAMEVCSRGSLREFAESLKRPDMQMVVSGGLGRASMLAGVAAGDCLDMRV